MCPLKINIFTLNAPISTNEVSMFKLTIEVCVETYFGLIHVIFLSLGSTKSVYFYGKPGIHLRLPRLYRSTCILPLFYRRNDVGEINYFLWTMTCDTAARCSLEQKAAFP